MYHPPLMALLASSCLVGCGDPETRAAGDDGLAAAATATPICEVVKRDAPLPREVRETSGLAPGTEPGRFWTHNDAGHPPYLFAVDTAGELVERVRVTGAESVDWEDLEAAPCEAGTCLYIGDIGDNDAERDHVTVYRIPEPAPGAVESEPAEALHARYPDGPRDAEALFVADDGAIYIINKGREEEIVLYRYPAPHRVGEAVTLERVRSLLPRPESREDYVTAATTTPDGRRVGIQTYSTLYVYPADALLGAEAVEPAVFDLTPLREEQGEALAMRSDGTVWLSSEAEGDDQPPRLYQLRCPFGIESTE